MRRLTVLSPYPLVCLPWRNVRMLLQSDFLKRVSKYNPKRLIRMSSVLKIPRHFTKVTSCSGVKMSHEIQHNNKWNATLSIMMFSIMALNTESCSAECHLSWVSHTSQYAEGHYAECRFAECRSAVKIPLQEY